jgi:hypothetical protein
VSSEAEAEIAARGLEGALERALDLGLDGFAAATSANIPPQSGSGDISGTMDVTGQADQGASDNKGLRLDVVLVDYADLETLAIDGDEDPLQLAYDTPEDDPARVELQLRSIPDGTMTGTMQGTFLLAGDLEGSVDLDLTVDGPIEDDGAGQPIRTVGATEVTGTATNSAGGTFDVDVTF